MKFQDLGLIKPILAVLHAQNYETPTPIQAQAIPAVLKGRDVVGLAQTGTGKTAAFALPLLQRLADQPKIQGNRHPRILVVAPTRELAIQIERSFVTYGKNLGLRSAVVLGGVSIRSQKQTLARGIDILVATPGRLLDLVNQKSTRLDQVQALVLDEGDHMLDIGFLPDIKRIIALVPKRRQTLLFSATMPREIRDLASNHLDQPIEISVVPDSPTVDRINQTVMVMPQSAKLSAIVKLVKSHAGKRIIVFTRTKHGADKVVKKLTAEHLISGAIHGNKSQGQRQRVLAEFTAGKTPVLIATDIAARGIDVRGIEIVVNYDLPHVAESYVHRIGRTARAGAAGLAISFCSEDEMKLLRAIEKLIKIRIPALSVDGTPLPDMPENVTQPRGPRRSVNRRRGGSGAPKGNARAWGDGPPKGEGAPKGKRNWSRNKSRNRAK